MTALRERLSWPAEGGRIQDGARRYLMMRPDVLMGALLRADPAVRSAMLEAFAASVAEHGADSLRAYAQSVGHDASALMRSTCEAAADLGWGRWQMSYSAGILTLDVEDSPFVAGWAQACASLPSRAGVATPQQVCAPILGMFTALVRQLGAEPSQVHECRCAVSQPGRGCRFEARWPMC